jgi:hypothetical protein
MELDLHADTIVLGKNCVVLAYTGRECDVSPYTESYAAIRGVPIVSGATAWTCQLTGETLILVFHEALWMGEEVDHSLVNPNQLRHFGITVQDNPYCRTQMHLSTEDEDVVIPLMSDGTVIHFSSRTPTEKELHECRHVELSSKAEWNPRDVSFPEAPDRVEEGKLMSRVSAIQVQQQQHHRSDCNCDCNCDGSIHLELPSIVERLISEVHVTDVLEDVPQWRTFVSNERHCSVSAAELSERWGIGLTQASNTIGITTQTGVRSAIMPLSRRYKADRVFERPLLRGQFFTDTMDGRLKSLDGNKYAQIFATKELFVVAYPMQSKISAGEGLRQFVHEYGRPEHLTFDGSREQCGKKTEFMKNVRKYSINYKVTEPDRPNITQPKVSFERFVRNGSGSW